MIYQVAQGGLMRCCLASLDDAMSGRTKPVQDGETHACKYCKNTMIVRGGVWHWDSDAALAAERQKT